MCVIFRLLIELLSSDLPSKIPPPHEIIARSFVGLPVLANRPYPHQYSSCEWKEGCWWVPLQLRYNSHFSIAAGFAYLSISTPILTDDDLPACLLLYCPAYIQSSHENLSPQTIQLAMKEIRKLAKNKLEGIKYIPPEDGASLTEIFAEIAGPGTLPKISANCHLILDLFGVTTQSVPHSMAAPSKWN